MTVCRNAEDTIADTVRSVIEQSYRNIEYIVIDGRSTDKTLERITPFRSKLNTLVSEDDQGPYDAMNKGIRLATGEVVAILHADDLFYDNSVIADVVHHFETGKTDIVYGDLMYVDRHDTDKKVRYWKTGEYSAGAFSRGWHAPHPSFFVRKVLYDRFGLYDTSLAVSADFDIMLRFICKYGARTVYIPRTLAKMRIGGISSSLRGIYEGNVNCIRAFKKNGMRVPRFYTVRRILPKVLQYLWKGSNRKA